MHFQSLERLLEEHGFTLARHESSHFIFTNGAGRHITVATHNGLHTVRQDTVQHVLKQLARYERAEKART